MKHPIHYLEVLGILYWFKENRACQPKEFLGSGGASDAT